jgi:hypothetical protein
VSALKAIAGGKTENITISNRNVTNQLSEAMKILSSSRAMKDEVALRVFQLCKEVDALAVSSRTAVADIMKANAKNPDDLDGKFEVHNQEKYMADIDAFLDRVTTTPIRKFAYTDFANVGLSAVDYAALEFVLSDRI